MQTRPPPQRRRSLSTTKSSKRWWVKTKSGAASVHKTQNFGYKYFFVCCFRLLRMRALTAAHECADDNRRTRQHLHAASLLAHSQSVDRRSCDFNLHPRLRTKAVARSTANRAPSFPTDDDDDENNQYASLRSLIFNTKRLLLLRLLLLLLLSLQCATAFKRRLR